MTGMTAQQLAISGCNDKIMCEKSYLLGIGHHSAGTECSVLCNRIGFSRLPIGLLVLSCQNGAGANLQRQTLLSSGDTVYSMYIKTRGI